MDFRLKVPLTLRSSYHLNRSERTVIGSYSCGMNHAVEFAKALASLGYDVFHLRLAGNICPEDHDLRPRHLQRLYFFYLLASAISLMMRRQPLFPLCSLGKTGTSRENQSCLDLLRQVFGNCEADASKAPVIR